MMEPSTSSDPKKNIANIYLPEIPSIENIFYQNSLSSQMVLNLISQTMCLEKNNNSETTLNLIENCLVSQDGTLYRIKLKKELYFHDHKEITADDAVFSVEESFKHITIGSQLFFISNIKKTGKYSFEVKTTHKNVDLLKLFCSKIFTLRKQTTTEHSIILSGKYSIASWTKDKITLNEFLNHKNHIKNILVIKKIPDDGIDIFQNQPFSYIYPDYLIKEKQINYLTQIKNSELNNGYSFILSLRNNLNHIGYIKEKMTIASYLCFSKQKNWKRTPLESFFPKDHPLYSPFVKPSKNEAVNIPIHLKILVPENFKSYKLLESYQLQCLNQGINIEFIYNKDQIPDGKIHSFFHVKHSNHIDILNFFQKKEIQYSLNLNPVLKKRWKKLLNSQDCNDHHIHLKDLLKNLIKYGNIIPLFYSSISVKTNADFKKTDHEINFHFFPKKSKSTFLSSTEDFKMQSLASLGSTIQMFAHDVKKPFSMMYGMLSIIENTDNQKDLKILASKYIPEVKKTIDSVNRMLSDIVEIGSDSNINKEAIDLEDIIESTLCDIFSYTDEPNIELNFNFNHYHKLNVDRTKILRIFSNIITNACQAMDFSENKITIETKEIIYESNLFNQVSINNTGSLILKDNLKYIFDIFFTKGKKKGTGLGLAICKKIIMDHGGKIWAESDPNKGTTFHLLLPIAIDQLCDFKRDLPKSTNDIKLKMKMDPLNSSEYQRNDFNSQSELDLENTILNFHKKNQVKIKILIVDDEPLYLSLLSQMITSSSLLENVLEIYTAKNSFQALTTVEHIYPHVIIMDIDLGKFSDTGFEIVKKIKRSKSTAKICIHSNRSWQEDQNLTMESQADFFLPKPMTRSNFLKLIANSMESISTDSMKQCNEKFNLVFLDDDLFFHDIWQEKATHFNLTSYFETKKFIKDLQEQNKFNSQTGFIIDFFLDSKEINGSDIAKMIKEIYPKKPVFMLTDAKSISHKNTKYIDLILEKDSPESFHILYNKIKKVKNT